MTINERIAAVREGLSLTQEAFSAQIGVSRSFLGQVEKGHSKPSVELLVGILAQCRHISGAWLMLGEGEMLQASPTTILTEAGLERELRELQAIARQGIQPLTWRVLKALNDAPAGLTSEQLQKMMGGAGLDGLLLLLKRQGLVILEAGRYHFSVPDVSLKARELADVGAAVEQGVLFLLEAVLPRLEQGQGGSGLFNAELKVKDVEAWLKALHQTLWKLLEEHDTPDGITVQLLIASTRVDNRGA